MSWDSVSPYVMWHHDIWRNWLVAYYCVIVIYTMLPRNCSEGQLNQRAVWCTPLSVAVMTWATRSLHLFWSSTHSLHLFSGASHSLNLFWGIAHSLGRFWGTPQACTYYEVRCTALPIMGQTHHPCQFWGTIRSLHLFQGITLSLYIIWCITHAACTYSDVYPTACTYSDV